MKVCASCLGALALATVACSTVPDDARIGIDAPSRAQFDPVGSLLDHRCGSLDCHGNPQRNLQIWGCEGMRLASVDDGGLVPGCRNAGGADTTEPEFDATYRSLVGLEPATMSVVVDGHGQNPELLTFVRKARGIESHKGGTLVTPGDLQDTCITSWLSGQTDSNACTQAIATTP